MTIREYIDSLTTIDSTAEEEQEAYELEQTLFACYEDDYDDFCMWALENGIDVDATEIVNGEEIPVTTLWAWDVCGD